MTASTEQLLEFPTFHRFTREEYYRLGEAGVFQEDMRNHRVELIEGDILDKESENDPPSRFRFNRRQYSQMAEYGVFQDQRVELVEGNIFDMAPMKDLHAVAMGVVREALMRMFPDCWVRDQLPFAVDRETELAPDFVVIPGSPRQYKGQGHPRSALLVVEIADTSLRFDRGKKASLYAAAGVRDYWVVNLIAECVEVMRNPVNRGASEWVYSEIAVLKREDNISPLAKPQATIPVTDLLP